MKKIRLCLLVLFSGFILSLPQLLPAQIVTIVRKIKSNHTPTASVSVVTLDAPPYKVYHAVSDTVTSSVKLKLISRNDQKRQIDFMSGTSTVKMVVDSLGIRLSKVTVSASSPEGPSAKTTDLSVNAILAVSKKLGIKCTVEGQ
jgi:hypothetical protein